VTVLGYVVVVVANNGNGFQPSRNVALIKFSIFNILNKLLPHFLLFIHSWGSAFFCMRYIVK